MVDNGHKFEAAVVPEDLIHTVLHLGHNQSGHNGYQRTYAAIKCVYYWKGMRKHILVHCKSCATCAKQRVQKTQFKKQIFEPGVQPMEFICIDLIGEFYPPSSKGNRYALTAVCMLTGFTFCIPIKNKTAQEVVTAWRNHISFPFGVCRKLLMDNSTEFKNDLFSQVAEQLGGERKIYTPPYQPQSNGRIEGFHNFLKSCLVKHISKNREWDNVAPLAMASYNWLPNQHSKESPFFVMFGRDALTNLKHLISPKLRYMGMEELILDLEIMSNIYQSQIHNLKLARQCVIEDQRSVPNPNINTGDLVLVRDHTSKSFMPKYKTDYHVIRGTWQRLKSKTITVECLGFTFQMWRKLTWSPSWSVSYLIMMHLAIKEGSALIQKEWKTLVEHSMIKIIYLTLLTFQMHLLQQPSRDLTQCNWEVQKCKRSPSIILILGTCCKATAWYSGYHSKIHV